MMSRSLRAHRGLHGLTKLRALSSLNLSDNNAVRDIGLESLTRLCSLKHLDLSYTGVLLILDTAMRVDRYDRLDHRPVPMVAVVRPAYMPTLLATDIKIRVRDVSVASCSAALSDPRASLCAGVSDHGLRQVALLTQLESLNLDSREVTDAGLAHITSLARLRSLDLFGAKVTDRGCAHLRRAALSARLIVGSCCRFVMPALPSVQGGLPAASLACQNQCSLSSCTAQGMPRS